MNDELREDVRRHYASAAIRVNESCCASTEEGIGMAVYGGDDLDTVPSPAALASLGCGNPTAVAELKPGETVLDLGSGGGIDVFLSARRVGPSGFAYGLDMTGEMLDLARWNQKEAGIANVEFLEGYIEEIPLPDASVDVVISNCVINLSPDKPAVFTEIARVLRPGGRIGVSDIVAENHLSTDDRRERGNWAGCVAGALTFADYETGLRDAGFVDISIVSTHMFGDGMHSAIIKAVKPA